MLHEFTFIYLVHRILPIFAPSKKLRHFLLLIKLMNVNHQIQRISNEFHCLFFCFSWTYNDANVTCKSLGFSNGTFYSYTPATNLTSHLKIFAPKCTGHEKSLFDCVGTSRPEQGLSVCERLNVVSLHCEGFDNDLANEYDNWAGLVFQRHAPYTVVQQYSALFTNISQSVLECVDVEYAGLSVNRQKSTPGWYGRPHYDYRPGSAVTVFQYGPTLRDLKVRWSLGNGLNFSNVEAPVAVHGGIFEANRGESRKYNTCGFNTWVIRELSREFSIRKGF